MTAATKAGGAVLPVVANVYPNGATVRLEWASVHAAHNAQLGDLTPRAPAQATIDELRAEVEALLAAAQEQALQYLSDNGQWIEETGRLRAEVERLTRERDRWITACHEAVQETRDWRAQHHALKAKQIDVEAVMRLADEWVVCEREATTELYLGTCADFDESTAASHTAREALRASLLGDGGTAAMASQEKPHD